MSELLTLSKNHPDFNKFLDGSFSDQQRALPIQSLNVNTELEQVTFRIVDVKDIKKPFLILRWAQIIKARNFLLVALPIFIVLMKNMMDETVMEPVVAASSALGVFLLHAAVNLRNDYIDHMSGLDRIHPHAGSRAIQRGWLPAFKIKRLSHLCLFFGALFGLPAVYYFQEVLILLAILVALGLVGLFSFKMGLKYRQWSELFSFLLLGPFLTVGFQIACGAGFDYESLFIGCVTGWYAVFYLHLKNFEHLMVNSQARFFSSVAHLGFEKSKILLFVWWVIFLILFNVYHFEYSSGYWAWMGLMVSVLSSFVFLSSLISLESLIGSAMTRLIFQARYMSLFVLTFWSLENLWYLWLMNSSLP